jgi:anti-sigma factor RsiW
VTCEDARSFLDAYLDGELDLVRSLEIGDHLRECAACARQSEEFNALRTAIRDGATYYSAGDDLRSRIRAAAGASEPRSRERDLRVPRYGWGLIGAAAALALVAIIAKGGMFWPPSRADQTAREVVADHVRSLMVNHLTDVLSSNQHTVKPWFEGKLDFSPEVDDLAGKNFTLVGGRLEYLNNRAVAALVYRRRQHVINLFVWPTPGIPDTPASAGTHQGYNVIHWTKAGMAYWAVSSLDSAELEEFAQAVRDFHPAPPKS